MISRRFGRSFYDFVDFFPHVDSARRNMPGELFTFSRKIYMRATILYPSTCSRTLDGRLVLPHS